MLNRINIMGRLTKDPELKKTESQKSFIAFKIAVEDDYKNKDGERNTDFMHCVAWNATAEHIAKYYSKGRMIVIDGKLKNNRWTDNQGNQREQLQIVAENVYFGDSAGKGNQQQNSGYPSAQQQNGGYPPAQQQNGGYPSAPQQNNGYPSAPQQNNGYPSAPQQNNGYPSAPQQNNGYPSAPQQNNGYPSAPQQNDPYGYGNFASIPDGF